MTKSYKKCFYVVATTKAGEHFYTEGGFTDEEINKYINEFNIDEFLDEEAVDEEYTGPEAGHYAVYRQTSLSDEEMIDIGVAFIEGDTFVYSYSSATDEAKQKYDQRRQEIEAEVEQEFGIDNDPLVCLKQFA